MKKNIVFILLLCIGCNIVRAQEVYNSSGKAGYHKKTHKRKGYDPDKLIVGGGLNAGFGDGYINVGLAPIVGYRITNHFAAGVGLGYQYNRDPVSVDINNNLVYRYENIIYPSIWMRQFLYRSIFAEVIGEYDFINLRDHTGDYNPATYEYALKTHNIGLVSPLVGIGLRQPLGGRTSFFIEVLYDVLQQQESPYYGQPVFRAGIALGM